MGILNIGLGILYSIGDIIPNVSPVSPLLCSGRQGADAKSQGESYMGAGEEEGGRKGGQEEGRGGEGGGDQEEGGGTE